MTDLAALKTVLRIEEAQTAGFRFGKIAREYDDPVVKLVLTRIAEDEGRNAKLVKQLMAHLSGKV